ncbi:MULTISPECIES: MFS transporter [unclassified Streptomyces]|uniref:MFS transporter n=1 Tax=unclassified Streptomyces TaxID=2593676 RepID=UPI002E357639|nr:MFS transporter [Streptomyces sp. NBC_01280]
MCGLLGVAGLWLRNRVGETEQFAAAGQEGRVRSNPLRTMREHPGAALRVFAITIAGTVIYYVWIVYLAQYAQLTTGLPLSQGLWANTIAQAVFIVALPFCGKLSDRFGRKPPVGSLMSQTPGPGQHSATLVPDTPHGHRVSKPDRRP